MSPTDDAIEPHRGNSQESGQVLCGTRACEQANRLLEITTKSSTDARARKHGNLHAQGAWFFLSCCSVGSLRGERDAARPCAQPWRSAQAPTPLRCSVRGRAAELAPFTSFISLKQLRRVRGTKRAVHAAPGSALPARSCDRYQRREWFARVPVLLLVGLVTSGASSNVRSPSSNKSTTFPKAPNCPARTIATDRYRSNDGGRNIFKGPIERFLAMNREGRSPTP